MNKSCKVLCEGLPKGTNENQLKKFLYDKAKSIDLESTDSNNFKRAKVSFSSRVIAKAVVNKTRKKELNGNEIRLYIKNNEENKSEETDEYLKDGGVRLGDYVLRKKIGSGGFGSIYMADDIYNNRMVAIKIDKNQKGKSKLQIEWDIYSLTAAVGMAECYAFFKDNGVSCLVMPFYGKNIAEWLRDNSSIQLYIQYNIIYQMINAVRRVHEVGVIHRDVKPDNFVFGKDEHKGDIYLIDFGLSKHFMNNGEHIEANKNKGVVGTPRYLSIRAHKGYELSRRDDLESMFYVIIQIIKGELPWRGINIKDKKERYAKIYEKKKKVDVDNLCMGVSQLIELYNYIRNLKFAENPDYTLILGLINDLYLEYKQKNI